MKYHVHHVTTYHTSEPVSVCHNMARLRPRETVFQQCRSHHLAVSPHESSRTEHQDAFGNYVTSFSSSTGYDTLVVTSVSEVDVKKMTALNRAQSPAWEAVASESCSQIHKGDPRQFLFDSPRVYRAAEFRNYAFKSFTKRRPILDALGELTERVFNDFEYDQMATNVTTPIRDVFANRAGVCQDFAHVQIAMLRSLGLPTRYVSGYIKSDPPEGGEAMIGSAASHAWLSVFTGDESLGHHGWVDVDPTNKKFLTDEYVTIAWGRDYSDVAPLKGVFVGTGQHTLEVGVTMQAIEA